MTTNLIDITSLDLVGASDSPHAFELKDESGNPLGLKLLVLGAESEKVQKFTTRRINEARRNAALRAKRGKQDEVDSVEDDLEFTIEACVIRTVGWEGALQPFSPELARTLYARNPHLRSQVLEASGNIANFTRS